MSISQGVGSAEDDTLSNVPQSSHTHVKTSPIGVQEVGSLTQSTRFGSRFVGSSSGIFFINTVKKAFEASVQVTTPQRRLPAPEETVGGEDDFFRHPVERELVYELAISTGNLWMVNGMYSMGSIVPHQTALECTIEFFKQWHPILPFLSGTAFLQELESFYARMKADNRVGRLLFGRKDLCQMIIIQCVVAIGASEVSVNPSSPTSGSFKVSDILALVIPLCAKHDILTIQTVLAVQLCCASTMALRMASTISGLLTKMLVHAGLHRCPQRYDLSAEECDLRKRIFWSYYLLDRYLCQALGLPLSLPDSDIDVCVSGEAEYHAFGVSRPKVSYPSHDNSAPLTNGNHPSATREGHLAIFIRYGKLLDQALEIFHKSIHARQSTPQTVLFLKSEVDRWYNSLPEESPISQDQASNFIPFFYVLYEQLVITINRPSLSLPRSSAEFQYSLQVTVQSAKRTINILEREKSLFWPGYLASVWMSGLILSFACQLGMYSTTKGCLEVRRCLDLLRQMSDRWPSAQRCHVALSTLLTDLQKPKRRSEVSPGDDGQHNKRRRVETTVTDRPIVLTSEKGDFQRQIPANAPAVEQTPDTDNPWLNVNDWFQDLSWDALLDFDELGTLPDFHWSS